MLEYTQASEEEWGMKNRGGLKSSRGYTIHVEKCQCHGWEGHKAVSYR